MIKYAINEILTHVHRILNSNNIIAEYKPPDNSITLESKKKVAKVAQNAIDLLFDDIVGVGKRMPWRGFNLLYHLSASSSCKLCVSENLNSIWSYLQDATYKSRHEGAPLRNEGKQAEELINPDLMDMLLQLITHQDQKYQDEPGFDGYWLLRPKEPSSILREYFFPYLEKILTETELFCAYVIPEKARVVLLEFLKGNRRRFDIEIHTSQLAVRRNPEWRISAGEAENIAASWLQGIKVKYPNSPAVQAIFGSQEEKQEEK
jgi:hypothetical protein